MSDERSTFETTRARLEEIVGQARRKDVSLEQSLDLLEEAVRLVNQCNDLIDQTSFKASADVAASMTDDATARSAVADAAEVTVAADGDGAVDVVETSIVAQDDTWGSVDAWSDADVVPGEPEDDARE